MPFHAHYHNEKECCVVLVSGHPTAQKWRKKHAGYDVTLRSDRTSATDGHTDASDRRRFDERDSEEKAIAFALMKAPFVAGASRISEHDYRRLQAQYQAEFDASSGRDLVRG